MNRSIVCIDTEVSARSAKILDFGAVNMLDEGIHTASYPEFIEFVNKADFICGHNIIRHDLVYLQKSKSKPAFPQKPAIDTLFLSPLLFPLKPYHALLKDDKLQLDELSNPFNDCKKAKDLFWDEVYQFGRLPSWLQQIYYHLLKDVPGVGPFFDFLEFKAPDLEVKELIMQSFNGVICHNAPLEKYISNNPLELAYCLALINTRDRCSITPPWVLMNFPVTEYLMIKLRNQPCLQGCEYCNQALDAHKGLKTFFGFDAFRSYNGQPLQELAARAAVEGKSLLAVFPTGGGKSITFQVPALMAGENARGLTVVISPLQSLMKDQVDNLEKQGITNAVTINGLLDPIERGKAFESVENGSASLLYISPESLRSKSIERLLLNRKVVRFVIDEAHCFSSWGQDFRVDYLYIGEFIRMLQKKKNLEEPIPVSCFTATAKQKVIDDIRSYFKEKLSLHLEVFRAPTSRTNLYFRVFQRNDENSKYNALRDLIVEKKCPTIVYVSRTRKTGDLAEHLRKDGISALAFHGKMENQQKTENQNAFISGEVPVMVATSAFGMGVDKKDVGLVVHYEISDSLENYVQEAGRAGRDESIEAECYVLYDEEDLSKHFLLLNQTRINIKEIQQVWRAVKDLTRFRESVSNSALEIARKAGWDDSVSDIETRVTTAIAALEEAGYLKRGQNMPRILANSILSKTAQEAIDKIQASGRFDNSQKVKAVRIIKKLFSSKSRKQIEDETPESRVDYISDHLGIVKEEVIQIVNLLREEKILADNKDLRAFVRTSENSNALHLLTAYCRLEEFLLTYLDAQEKTLNLKEINEAAQKEGIQGASVMRIKTIFNFWAVKNWIKKAFQDAGKNHLSIALQNKKEYVRDKLEKRRELAGFIMNILYSKALRQSDAKAQKDYVNVDFSVHELKEAYNAQLIKRDISIADVEDSLFFLTRTEAMKIEGGFLVVYNRLQIQRLEEPAKQYKKQDYQKLQQFYENKIQQIHIVGEYARRMIDDYKDALQFVEDYFQLNYPVFLNKYFKGSRQDEIKRNITPARFRQLFGELSPSQLKIIKDNDSQTIVAAAGPGSGKTRVLVHKLASLLLLEEVKHDQLLMLTFSRAAATEFKKRLMALIGNAANFVEIKTFHSYCFDLLGRVGNIQKTDTIISEAIDYIRSGATEKNKVTKTVLVIDEAQDMNALEFELVRAIASQNDDMRIIAVGDDDQNIFEWRGARSEYLKALLEEKNAKKYELTENYRSNQKLVELGNSIVQQIPNRLKSTPITPKSKESGSIRMVKYLEQDFLATMVQEISYSNLSGSTCVMTLTNDDAGIIAGLLNHAGLPAKLIQENKNLKLSMLLEPRYLLDAIKEKGATVSIADELWEEAKAKTLTRFKHTRNFALIAKLIGDFETTNSTRKYVSDLEVFIKESELNDFIETDNETIYVSTIHKAKGREFENVFLHLKNFDFHRFDNIRLLYVAATRAKRNLFVHLNGHPPQYMSLPGIPLQTYSGICFPAGRITLFTDHHDVVLSKFHYYQSHIFHLSPGDVLCPDAEGCKNQKGDYVLKYSKDFLKKLQKLQDEGYKTEQVGLAWIVYWYDEKQQFEVKIALPEICLSK